MKRLAIALLATTVFASSALALVGGPWDNNIPGNPNKINPSITAGLYQGSIKGKNTTGVFIFSGASTFSVPVVSGSTITSSQGFATVFTEGKTANAAMFAAIDLPGRKLWGTMQGSGTNSHGPVYLTRPATSTSPEARWQVATDSIWFNGAFSAKLSSSWADTHFSGKGTLTTRKVNIADFYQQLITAPTTASPHIVTIPLVIKISGMKTSDYGSVSSLTVPIGTDPVLNKWDGTAFSIAVDDPLSP